VLVPINNTGNENFESTFNDPDREFNSKGELTKVILIGKWAFWAFFDIKMVVFDIKMGVFDIKWAFLI
jgi:hypothetical protein